MAVGAILFPDNRHRRMSHDRLPDTFKLPPFVKLAAILAVAGLSLRYISIVCRVHYEVDDQKHKITLNLKRVE